MTNEEIKNECELQFAQIKNAEERLKELRSICKHEETFVGNYSWRPGAVNAAEICTFCITPVKILDFPTSNVQEPILHNQ